MSTEPVGLATDLAPKGVQRSELGRMDLAIWRSVSGVVSAWENRCPHRGMRLSHGFVRGESLACAYHGWHYDCGGKCHYIPAHPELEPPSKIRPAIYSVIEQAGVIWVNTESDANPISLPSELSSVRSITFESSLDVAVKAFSNTPLEDDSIVITEVNELHANPKTISLSTATTADSIIVLFQKPSLTNVVCHVLASNQLTIDSLVNVSRWCESVRRAAELLIQAEQSSDKKSSQATQS